MQELRNHSALWRCEDFDAAGEPLGPQVAGDL
jgi:hypothetical protein